jgi:hypothetical protein
MSITNIHCSSVRSKPINWQAGMKCEMWMLDKKKVTEVSAIKFLKITELVRLSDKNEKEHVT